MTTITINEKVNIKGNFNTFFDLYKYINENINIEIEELESQDSILKSENYKKYDKIFSKKQIKNIEIILFGQKK